MKTNLKPKSEPVPARSAITVKIVIVGHVDHGKSTLIGRLLYDTDSLPDGKFEQIKASSEKRGMPFEWSFLTDALQSERDQAITVDTTQIRFKTAARDYVIIDAPGHKEFLKNMISGAAGSEAALLLIDAKEGVKEQSKRHGYLLHLLGVRQVAVLINKMDLVDYSQDTFERVKKEYLAYLKSIGVDTSIVIPLSAREGDNMVTHSKHMPWYKGPSVAEALDQFKPTPSLAHLPLRFPIQDVYKFDERRILVGRVESGSLKVGDELLFSPLGNRAKIKSIEAWPDDTTPKTASAGQSVGITLTDQIFIERGHIASHAENAPILTNRLRARIFWLGHKPLAPGKRYKLKLATSDTAAELQEVVQVVDTDTLSHKSSNEVARGQVAEIILRTRGLVAVDDFILNPKLGRFVLLEDYDVVGGGILSLEGIDDQRVAGADVKSKNITSVDLRITPEQHARVNGHLGGVLWFTGLSGSGKSTLALELQHRLFTKGYQVFVLDGDNIRAGLNTDLGFAPKDRTENIRRVGEVAALFAKAGIICIASFISPYREDRRRARAAGGDAFHLIHIKASVEDCEKRDTKGLYKKARAGEIKEFTGISAPYEEPENPDLVIDTANLSVSEAVDRLLDYIKKQLVDPASALREGQQFTGGGI